MKIVMMADTHERHGLFTVPDGDVLIHAGDMTLVGEPEAIAKFGRWFAWLPHKHKIAIAGNHDWLFEKDRAAAKRLLLAVAGNRVSYLENESVTIDGVKFWGSPVTPSFMNWAFNVNRGEAIQKYWDMIPPDVDVLITHGPPYGILDQAAPHLHSEHCGCLNLKNTIRKMQMGEIARPRVHVFGHIHGGYGRLEHNNTQFFNASVVDEAYRVRNAPWIVDISGKSHSS